MKYFHLDILELSETYRIDENLVLSSTYKWYGHKDKTNNQGVGFIYNTNLPITFTNIDNILNDQRSRLILAQLEYLAIVEAYTPTGCSINEEKTKFFSTFLDIYQWALSQNLDLVVLGDFNGHIQSHFANDTILMDLN